MKIIKPYFDFLDEVDGGRILRNIESYGRTCYKSEDLITDTSAIAFAMKILKRGHESVIEHEKITARIVCDRGVSHEIVRHRLASYSQESTRYCNYQKDKFGSELTFIKPVFWKEGSPEFVLWSEVMQKIEKEYMRLIDMGAAPQEARSILPNSLKTEVIMTMNLREWRHFLRLRTSEAAHPQMREITRPMLDAFKAKIPVLFDDINY